MLKLLKKNWADITFIFIFLIVACIRFAPQLEGKVIQQADVVQATSMQKEAQDYNASHDTPTYWINNMFCGMPSYSIRAPLYNPLKMPMKILQLGFKAPIGFFLMAMICLFFFLRIMSINVYLAGLVAIAFSFCSNHIVLWEAGHTNKLLTIANAALIIASLYLAYAKKNVIGSGLLFAFSLALSIKSGHIQMTYYLFIALLLLTLGFVIDYIKKGKIIEFFKDSLGLIVGLVVGIMLTWNALAIQYSFKNDTMRGAPILKSEVKQDPNSSSAVEGLAWDYAMQWSNGPLDMLSLIVPRAAGGGSVEKANESSRLATFLRQRGVNTKDLKLPYYHGSLPFTSGAVYFGIVFFFFYLIACINLKGPWQWWLISSFLLLSLLAMGKHMSWFNYPFFNYFPLYNSFRAPSSITTVSILPVIMGAALGVRWIMENKFNVAKRSILISASALSLICICIGFVLPSFLDFSSPGDARLTNAGYDVNLLKIDRESILRSDALRGLFFLGMTVLSIYLYYQKKISANIFAVLVGLLTIADTASIGMRYLDNSNWTSKRNVSTVFNERPVDTRIKSLEPHRGAYRVLDLSIDVFQSASSSYHHNTIGGYNAAKLQRFQDMIDFHLSKNNIAVLNMLNAKYIISREQKLQVNSGALGNAWFVNDVKIVGSPEEEIGTLSNFDPKTTAVVLKSDFTNYEIAQAKGSDDGTVLLTEYSPKKLVYKSNSQFEKLAVFSEIWFGPDKGWTAYIDDVAVDHIRANYCLRAMNVPAGNHTITFEFDPPIVRAGNNVSVAGVLLLLFGIFYWVYNNFKIRIK